MRPEYFQNFKQREMIVPYRRFGSTYQSHLQGYSSPRRKSLSWTAVTLKMGQIGCPETSVIFNT